MNAKNESGVCDVKFFNQNYFVVVTLIIRDFIVKILKYLFDLTEQRSQLFRIMNTICLKLHRIIEFCLTSELKHLFLQPKKYLQRAMKTF